ncbi:MAG: hypothetical protein ACJ76P_05325 [Actinomycetota bacterium]
MTTKKANVVQAHPAETGAGLAATALLLLHAFGVGDPWVSLVGVVAGVAPGVITWAKVKLLPWWKSRQRGK